MKYGFIGLGNMASAIIKGMRQSPGFDSDEIYGYNRSFAKTQALMNSCKLIPSDSICALVQQCDVIILAVKPQVLPDIMGDVASCLVGSKVIITVAAGKNLGWYAALLPKNAPVIRAMPNINARVGCGVCAICPNESATAEHIELARGMFESVGKVYDVSEKLFASFSAIGGASGAFVCLYIDALAQAGVKAGFPRALALELACQTVLGSAKLISSSAEHPIAIMDQICSPGGTTIEGVLKLKELGFESAVHRGIAAIIDKDARL